MIYTRKSIVNEECIFFDEAAVALNEDILKFASKSDVPADFEKTALKLLDCIERTGLRIKGGPNDNMKDVFNIFTKNVRKKINDRGPGVRAYCYAIPNKLQAEWNDFIHTTMISAGFKKGKPIPSDHGGDGKKLFYYYKKSKSNNKEYYYLGYGQPANGSIQIYLQCIESDNYSKSVIESAPINISASDVYGTDRTNESYKGSKYSTERYINNFSEAEHVTNNFYRNPKVTAALTEHMDLTDKLTRTALRSMNEADQNSVLTALTSKLYDNIVEKVDDIDYGDIPSTRGDITKLPNYKKLIDCINILHDILVEFKQETAPIDVISEAFNNIIARKDLFMRAYKYDVELPIIMYDNIVLGIIDGISYMIATSIEFMKTPGRESFEITLDKVSYAKTKSNLLYKNLKKFNDSCKSKEFDKAMEHVLQNRIKKLSEGAAGIVASIVAISSSILLILNIIPILRELVFFFYYTRMRVSEFFDIQADLLQMNAYNVQNDDARDEEEKEKIVSKQLKIIELFRKMANKISITGKKAEVKATKEITNTNKKMKLMDVTDEVPDSVSALF